MATKAKSNNLQEVKNNKKDEFYTQLSDIERALTYYKKQFKDKVVYFNCDNPRVSNFFHFFSSNFMRACCFFLSLSILLASCQGNEGNTTTATETSKQRVPPIAGTVKPAPDTVAASSTANNKQKLALTSNALQLVDAVSGSTSEIAFGMPFDQLVVIVNRVLESKPTSVGVNMECGAGPLKMATWSNGLTLVFGEKKRGNSQWLFAGWFAGNPTGKAARLTTMAGVGVGSTREELENAYVTTITKTTLGQEFSVESGFYGILSGTGTNAIIEVMWSGTSCNFR